MKHYEQRYFYGNPILACLIFVATGQMVHGEDRADLLSVARDRHRAAREAIRTLSAEVTIEAEILPVPRKTVSNGKYWRSQNTVRVQEFPSGTDNIEEHVLKDGEIRSVGRHRIAEGRYDRYGADRASATEMLAMCDVWREMLLDFFGPAVKRYDYDSFIALSKRPPKATREKVDGVECVRVSMTIVADDGTEWAYTFWHDIDRNYLIRKVAVDIGNGATKSDYDILEFQEAVPGVFVPVSCRLRVFEEDKLKQEIVTTLSKLKVNEPIAREVFTLPAIPTGTVLHDRIEVTRYPIDENWRAIGPKVANPIVSLPARTDGPGIEYTAQSSDERKPLSRWLLPVSALVLVAACAIWAYRRRHARNELALDLRKE